MIVGKKV